MAGPSQVLPLSWPVEAMLKPAQPIRLPADLPPRMVVVIDTEEEFDWSAEPDRTATAVRAMRHIDRVQRIFDDYAIRPAYVVDYPVASQPEGYGPLREIAADGRCEIGAHLHPWVNPPHDEPLSRRNMYPGNLEAALERAKLERLTDAIGEAFGERPRLYKAGRYGVGPHTTTTLEQLGYEVDLSVCPPVDYRADGGPDYSDSPTEPYWFGERGRLLELPITGAFVGWARVAARALYRAAVAAPAALRLPGVLARSAAVDRLMLSPEGFSPAEHVKLTRALHARGVRTFTWSFHSPSVVPGCTPYVRTQAELERFLDAFRRFFDFFFGTLEGVATTPYRLKQELEELR